MEEQRIENSHVENSEIEDSNVEDSEIESSKIKDSYVKDSEIEDSTIEDSRIVGEKVISVKNDNQLIKERKEKFILFLKKPGVWIVGFLIIALILGIYIRSLPMTDHGGRPGLWDITTDTWTLGPDLDPWLFLRYAKIIIKNGSIPSIDMMRNVPVGLDTSFETKLLPHMIAGTYYFLNIFSETNIEYAGVIFPVIMFALTIISFFLFVREIFVKKSEQSKIRASIIALISTFFMIVIPTFLSRTIAGIPEKESAGFFFMFLAFYLFLKAWKTENLKNAIILGILSGISTALMALIWRGVVYIFIAVALATLIAFILNKVGKKEFFIYNSWLISSIIIMLLFSNRYSLRGLIQSTDTIIAFLTFFVILVHFILWNTKLSRIKILTRYNLPKNIVSLIISILLGVVLISIVLGPGFILEKISQLNTFLITPVAGRWGVTVAENRQPYFTEWRANFGPFIKNIPILFWLFFIGSAVLFKDMLKYLKKKDAWVLTGFYILFFLGLVFSRYSPTSTFNGTNFISKFFYLGSVFLFIISFVYYYIMYYKKGDNGFEKINFELIFLFSLFILCLTTVRGAVRLIMILAPFATIFVGYLIVENIDKFRKAKDETWKIILGIFIILILILSFFAFFGFYKSIKMQAYAMVPSYYNYQWQKAMKWVREETPEDAVFAHWWDYGYWVQSIGDRATVLDGGNAILWWNYLMGRLVLTGDNQKDALEYLSAHNATHLLIDSSDIGKYTAFSSIGSDENYDRYSWIPVMVSDQKQIKETRNGTTRVYSGGYGTDEDIVYEMNGNQIFLPAQKTGIAGIILETVETNETISFKQPEIVFVYQGKQIRIPIRYIYRNWELIDFGEGLEATIKIVQKIDQTEQGVQIDRLGAIVYISPRVMRGMLAQKYLLNGALNNFPNFELIYQEENLIVSDLRNQGLELGEFVYFNGLQGPIKIWEINYTGDEEFKEKYVDKGYAKYIDWFL